MLRPILFPGRLGGPKRAGFLCTQIKHYVQAAIGLVLSAHNFRHAGAKIFLDERPGQYEVVRLTLAHRQNSTVTGNYTGASTRAAARICDTQILKVRRRDPKQEG